MNCRRCRPQRLKWTLHHAYNNVPMYKRKFDAAGVHPDDFHRAERTCRNSRAPPSRICATTTRLIPLRCRWSRWYASMRSSGTTGKPTVVGYTQNDIDNWANIVARSLRAAGGQRRRIKFTSPTATVCSPAGWGRTTVPSVWERR